MGRACFSGSEELRRASPHRWGGTCELWISLPQWGLTPQALSSQASGQRGPRVPQPHVLPVCWCPVSGQVGRTGVRRDCGPVLSSMELRRPTHLCTCLLSPVDRATLIGARGRP